MRIRLCFSGLSIQQAPSLTAQLVNLAEQQDIQGLEAALEGADRWSIDFGSMQPTASESDPGSGDGKPPDNAAHQSESSSVCKAAGFMKEASGQPKGWERLTVLERDVLAVLMAFCKVHRHVQAGFMGALTDSTVQSIQR